MSYICIALLIVLSGCLNDGIVSIVTLRASPGLTMTGIVIGANHGTLTVIVSFHALYVGSRYTLRTPPLTKKLDCGLRIVWSTWVFVVVMATVVSVIDGWRRLLLDWIRIYVLKLFPSTSLSDSVSFGILFRLICSTPLVSVYLIPSIVVGRV